MGVNRRLFHGPPHGATMWPRTAWSTLYVFCLDGVTTITHESLQRHYSDLLVTIWRIITIVNGDQWILMKALLEILIFSLYLTLLTTSAPTAVFVHIVSVLVHRNYFNIMGGLDLFEDALKYFFIITPHWDNEDKIKMSNASCNLNYQR